MNFSTTSPQKLTFWEFYLSYYFYDAPALTNPPVPVRVEVMRNIVHYENKSNPNWNVIECVIQYNIAGVIYEQSNISKMRLETGLKYDATFPRGRPDLARIEGTNLIDREYSHQLLIFFAVALLALLWITISRIYFVISLKLGSFELHKLEERPQKVQDPFIQLWVFETPEISISDHEVYPVTGRISFVLPSVLHDFLSIFYAWGIKLVAEKTRLLKF